MKSIRMQGSKVQNQKASIKNSEYREFTHEDRTWNIKYNIIDEPSDDMYEIQPNLASPGITQLKQTYIWGLVFIREVELKWPSR